MTTRCVMESTLCQTTICPAGMVEGFGENDWDPLTATTLIVTAVPGTGQWSGTRGVARIAAAPDTEAEDSNSERC